MINLLHLIFIPHQQYSQLYLLLAFSANGSVDKNIFFKWYQEVICILYPDIQNAPGKRVLLKSDGGPGRTHEDYLAQSNLDGLVHYPGLPNGTFFQELDQIFAYLKSTMEHNRKQIWDVLFEIDGHKAKVEIHDFAKILFGGKYTFKTGAYINLPNAFAEGLSKDHLDSAIRKCGYVPANRIALQSRKLRHELVTNLDGELDQDLNDLNMADTLLELEKMNHETITELEEKGFKLASTLKRTLRRRQNGSSSSTTPTDPAGNNLITVPGTTERQRALVLATTQGKHFKATNGGAPMNSDDWICSAELKFWDMKIGELQKKKKAVKKQRKTRNNANKAIGSDPNKWTIPILKAKISEKDPSLKSSFFTGLRKDHLVELWANDYANREDKAESMYRLTKKEQRLLEFLEQGKILNYEKTGVYKRAVKGRLEFLLSKLEHIDSTHALALVMKVFQDNFQCQEDATLFFEENFNKNYTSFVDDIQACDELDSCSSDDESYYSDDEVEGRLDTLDEVDEEDVIEMEDDTQVNDELDEEEVDDESDNKEEVDESDKEEVDDELDEEEGDDELENEVRNEMNEEDDFDNDEDMDNGEEIVTDSEGEEEVREGEDIYTLEEATGAGLKDCDEEPAKVSPANSSSSGSANETLDIDSIEASLASGNKESRSKLKELYEHLYGEPHPNSRVRNTTLIQLIKEKL